MYLAIKFNDKYRIPEKLKLITIKAIKVAINESKQSDIPTLFLTTKKSYNLKYEIVNIIWHYNLILRELNNDYFPGLDNKSLIDESTYSVSFKKFINLYEFAYLTDSLVTKVALQATIILGLNESLVVRRDL